MQANVFDLQRNSFVDGPGIRTTVFFKGCNLRCVWCHNPESWEGKPQLLHYQNRCTRCGMCASACPAGAIAADGGTDRALCTACGCCEPACPRDARRRCGEAMPIQRILDVLERDRPYFERSGGGLTASGGECMLQIDALEALLDQCRSRGIHTAVDTAGHVPWSSFQRILPLADLFLYDVKCLDTGLHERLTGVGNERILDNYRRLQAVAAEKLLVRVPVVPGSNDVNGQMQAIEGYLHCYPPSKVEWLPYHRLGEAKASALGLSPFAAAPPTAERMRCLRSGQCPASPLL